MSNALAVFVLSLYACERVVKLAHAIDAGSGIYGRDRAYGQHEVTFEERISGRRKA